MTTPTSTPSTVYLSALLQMAVPYVGRRFNMLSPTQQVIARNLLDRGILVRITGVLDLSPAAQDAAASLDA